MSFIGFMKDKTRAEKQGKVMKDKPGTGNQRNVLHGAYERQRSTWMKEIFFISHV
ncbi:hypothetical protein HMPREF3213_03593 [Heyndrickxia coagulans]|uniref:Uncharacterized protein n=1 Tax=Heyndrickxia coagulans TaxID=1398 RepID=A0A133KBI0_HEYCO|nr:hypothetical protein HMPREF3213_03593 [Heyndrickxia coagulans]